MDSIDDFEKKIDELYGVYLDSTSGIDQLRDWFSKGQRNALNIMKKTHPELASEKNLDNLTFTYGEGDPGSLVLHECTQGQYKERNRKDGSNYVFLANMTLVSIYQYWEDEYRSKIAKELGIDLNDLKHDVMGDIRHFRRSIIHRSGRAVKEVDSCKVFDWFKEGDQIALTKERLKKIVFQLKKMVADFRGMHNKQRQHRPAGGTR